MKINEIIQYTLGLCLLLTLSAAACITEETAQGSTARQTNPKSLRLEDYIYEDHIRTVQFYRNDDPFSFPIMYLNDPSSFLNLEFDELITPNESASNFWVDFIHCNADWEKSNLLPIEYIDGFMYDQIYDWTVSQNTLIPYVHYWYKFPGDENSRIKTSGNYIMRVYRDGDDRDVVLTRRFVVADRKVNIDPNLGLSMNVGQRNALQNIAFDLHPGGLRIIDPYNDLMVKILVNGRWDNHKADMRPQFINEKTYTYDFNSGVEFPGGNEYRRFDIRSTRVQANNVEDIEHRDSLYYFTLYEDQSRTKMRFSSQQDFNGNYFISVQEFPDADFSSDYVLVKFRLEIADEFPEGDVYVFGKLSDWRCAPEAKMTYNTVRGRYEAELLLKQGMYDYAYVFQPDGNKPKNETLFEGSFNQTENYYTILVYYRSPGGRADELVGLNLVNYYDDQR